MGPSSTLGSSIEIQVGPDAEALLADAAFLDGWNKLQDTCPWATPFQSQAFIVTWYGVYKDRFQPVVARQSSPGGELMGLMALGLSSDDKELVIAGARQAEYHAWLARPEDGDSFIQGAMAALRSRFPGRSLVLRYLPPSCPIGWTRAAGRRGIPISIESFRRPLMVVLGDGSEVSASIRKSSKKRRMNRLKRLGEVRLEQICDEETLDSVFGEIITYYDLRQAAVYGAPHFRCDPEKRAFHLALMRRPGLLHVTIVKVGEQIVSAHLGLCGKGTVYLGIIAHNPMYSLHSPGKLHILMLAQCMAAGGLPTLDLTPGAVSWKNMFANSGEQVQKLTVFASRGELARFVVSRKARTLAKLLLEAARVNPQFLRDSVQRLRRLNVSSLLSKLRQTLWKDYEYRVYYMEPAEIFRLENRRKMARDRLEDLLCYSPAESWQTLEGFLSQSLKRLGEGCHVYTYVENGRLLHYCWMKERQKRTFFTEVGQEFHFPPGSASLFDAYTHPEGRGRKLYQMSLSQMAHDAAGVEGTQRVYGYVMSDNRPSRHVIEKIGFTYDRSFFMKVRLRRISRWSGRE